MNKEQLFQNFPILETKRALLRQWKMDDAEDVFDFGRDSEVSKYVLWDTHKTIGDTMDFLSRTIKNSDVVGFAIEEKKSKKVIGGCGIHNWDELQSQVELGFVLARSCWNRGLMTEILQKIVEFCFTELEINRIYGKCAVENIGSARVMEKCGMQLEGIMREEMVSNGKFYDVKWYAILKKDFQ